MTADKPRVVVVAGDVTIDWNVAWVPSPTGRGTTRVSYEPGGAALLGRVVSAVADRLVKQDQHAIEVHAISEPPTRPSPGDGRSNHSFAIWSLVEKEAGAKDEAKVWRISQALGVDDVPSGPPSPSWGPAGESPANADLVVLDAGPRFDADESMWPRAITSPDAAPWVVLKMSRTVAEGRLWEHLGKRHAARLIAVVRVNDLRATDAQISRELSWEQTAQDLLWELTYNPELKALSRCAHLVVSFGTSGALLLSSPADGPRRARLFFDPPVMEDEWSERYPGRVAGYTVCLAAAVAREIMLDTHDPEVGRAVPRGLAAMRSLHAEGYEAGDKEVTRLAFPANRIAEALAAERTPFAEVLVRESGAEGATPWTILEDVCIDGLEQVARRIVLNGPGEIVGKVPVARFGKLLTVHRQEIEGFRSVRSLIGQYAHQARPERPLSIAVFGRPGSGKSFGIKQIALSLLPGRIETLTFNLSQFHDPDQLLDAFHQVRDESLKGKLPLVFWDEFDAKVGTDELGWLKHFLAPMQDGEFQEGQVTHHIGPAIFVFAGGTKQRMQEFSAQSSDAFTNAKGRDFVSRLKGYVDILGPNPDGDARSDPHHVIRRAILLRSMLESRRDLFTERDGRRELQIDSGVLRAFLKVRNYVHGARSMESVIAMSLLDGKSRFERSCLPSEEQLRIHVDAPNFLEIVHGLVIEGPMLRELAETVHVAYCASMLAEGYAWREPGDAYLKAHDMLKPFVGAKRDGRTSGNLVSYELLAEDVREQNEDFARDIPNKLEAIGYQIRQSRSSEPGEAFPEEVIELLAEQEHDRWMKVKIRQLWSWGQEHDAKRLSHPAMLPWRELTGAEQIARYGGDGASRIGSDLLPESEKKKDRALIRAVAEILAQNGYRATKAAQPAG